MTHAFSKCAAPLSAFIILFHTASALSAPSGHLPLEGKALGVGQLYSRFAAFSMAGRILDFSLLPLEGGAPKRRRLALLAIARGLAPSYQSLLILDALIPIYYL